MLPNIVPIDQYIDKVKKTEPLRVIGKVIKVVGLVVEAQMQGVSISELCKIIVDKDSFIYAEIVGFQFDCLVEDGTCEWGSYIV